MEPPKSLETLIDDAKQLFSEIFGESPLFCSFAAGRVNLIGEHTDYNDGFVMPMVGNMDNFKNFAFFELRIFLGHSSLHSYCWYAVIQ